MNKSNLRYRNQGVALVLVLAFLALISVFIIGYFISASSELNSSTSYAAGISTNQLADTATNIVEGQIRAGTTRPSVGGTTFVDYDAWATQPGMLRTYPGGPNSDKVPSALYKLYSSNIMTVEGASNAKGFLAESDIPDSTPWYNQPALFTDLNEPVSAVDPRATAIQAKEFTTTAADHKRYPIINPNVFTVDGVSNAFAVTGAELTSDPGAPKTSGTNGPAGSIDASPSSNVARMPVRWLYVLKDGSVTAPSTTPSNSGKTANWTAIPNTIYPTPTNPIVGRIAFWTDDDTCRVNVNTAAGFTPSDAVKNKSFMGSYWDTPRTAALNETGAVSPTGTVSSVSLCLSQPASNEFQRYPGHPATTSLGLVFDKFLKSEEIYKLAPRLIGGGSLGGTKVSHPETDSALIPKADRLYSSVDELLYAMDDVTAALGGQIARKDGTAANLQTSNGSQLTPQILDQLKFFLTAHSRAPELNLYGRPRVTIWPVWPVFARGFVSHPHFIYKDNTTTLLSQSTYGLSDFRKMMTLPDKLLAFCSSIGLGLDDKNARQYIFQRYDPYSSTNDYAIQRNSELLNTYLRGLTSKPVPGFTQKTFEQKYTTSDRDQILAEIFDYVRCANLRDSTNDVPPKYITSPPPSPNGVVKYTYKYAPRGTVVPTVASGLGNAPGFGRFPLITEAALVFYHAGYLAQTTVPIKSGNTVIPAGTMQWINERAMIHHVPQTHQVQGFMMNCFLVLETFDPMQGYSTVDSFDYTTEAKARKYCIVHAVSGMDAFKITSASNPGGISLQIHNPSSTTGGTLTNYVWTMSKDTWAGRGSAGTEGFMHTLCNAYSSSFSGTLNPSNGFPITPYYYPFQSSPHPGSGGSAPYYDYNPSVLTAGTPITFPIVNGKVQLPPYGILLRSTDKTFNFDPGPNPVTLDVKFAGNIINRYVLKFPAGTNWPVPTDNIWNGGTVKAQTGNFSRGGFMQPSLNGATTLTGNSFTGTSAPGNAGWTKAPYYAQFSLAGRLSWIRGNSNDPFTLKAARDPVTKQLGDGLWYGDRWRQIFQPGDTIRSLIPGDPDRKGASGGSSNDDGDPRVLALLGPSGTNASGYFVPHPDYGQGAALRHAHNLRAADGTAYFNGAVPSLEDDYAQNPSAKQGTYKFTTAFGQMVPLPAGTYTSALAADLPYDVKGVKRWDGQSGPDFDTGTGNLPDGAYVGKPDEGNFRWKYWDTNVLAYLYAYPYFTSWQYLDSFESYFSPNRQVPSAVAFGSLLAGRKKHWQTLAFCPNTAGTSHPGNSTDPKDHLLLDLFTMPIVEPYAISEPFSTAGKVNMNYPIVPFTYIKRTTALRAVLQSIHVTAIPASEVTYYKVAPGGAQHQTYRYPLDYDMTISSFDWFFQGKVDNTLGKEPIFRSASQICEMYLYPYNRATTNRSVYNSQIQPVPTAVPVPSNGPSAMSRFWQDYTLTGDNLRERPYAELYPRLTTKSNTFTVYMRVQALRKRPGNNPALAATNALTFTEGVDQVLSEYRGSSTIERYIDPQDPRIVGSKPQIDPDVNSLEPIYRFRVVESKRFQ